MLYHAVLSIDAIALPLLPALRDRDLAYMLHETHAAAVHHARRPGAASTTPRWRAACADRTSLHRGACASRARPGRCCASLRRGEAPPRPPADSPPPCLRGGPPAAWTRCAASSSPRAPAGGPKAVLYTHEGMAVEGREMAAADGVGADDVLFVPPSIGHVSGLSFGIYMADARGRHRLPAAGLGCAARRRTDRARTVHLDRRRDAVPAGPGGGGGRARPGALAGLRVFRCGGASVPPGLIRQARALGVDAYRSYGMSEHPTVSGRAGQPDAVCIECDGIVHPLIEVRIVDPNDRPTRARPRRARARSSCAGPTARSPTCARPTPKPRAATAGC